MNKFIKKSGYYEMVLDGKHKGTALISIKDKPIVEKHNWILNSGGYVCTWINKQYIYLHRFLLQTKKEDYGDHKNHNPLDNRRSNIRIVNKSQNAMNKKMQSNNTSGIIGVTFRRERKYSYWKAYINIYGKHIHLLKTQNKEEAIKARQKAEEKYFKKYRYKK